MNTRKIAELFRKKEEALKDWYAERCRGVLLPVTVSVDIRNADFKMAVVDTNIFPAGFNNLCNTFSRTAAEKFRDYFQSFHPKAEKILIIPETFTRNIPYFHNVKAIEKLLRQAGFTTAVGYLGENLPETPLTVDLGNGESLTLEAVERTDARVRTASMDPDLLFLNNDCSGGIPEILKSLEQPVYPDPVLGWHNRSKKHHFEIYCQLIGEMGKILETDPWHFCPITICEREIDIHAPKDQERLADAVAGILKKVQEKYDRYRIGDRPYVFVKSNTGTFGLGLTHVQSPDEILRMSRKERQSLSRAKGGTSRGEFLIQEGIKTIDDLHGAPVEPVLYFAGGNPIGGFFRIHEGKDVWASLNAPGARFESLCFHKVEDGAPEDLHLHCDDHNDFFKAAFWLGKIAALAVGLEAKALQSA